MTTGHLLTQDLNTAFLIDRRMDTQLQIVRYLPQPETNSSQTIVCPTLTGGAKHKKQYHKLWQQNNKDKLKQYSRKYYQNHKILVKLRKEKYISKNKSKVAEYQKSYQQSNRLRLQKYNQDYYIDHKKNTKDHYNKNRTYLIHQAKDYRQNNKIKIIQKYHKYKKQNPEIIRLQKIRKRLKEKCIIHTFSAKEWKIKKERTNGFCPSCKNWIGVKKLTLDHIIPISQAPTGFIYRIDDVQPLCGICNSEKATKVIYFA